MNYSVDTITTIADCDALLSAASLNKIKLQAKKAIEQSEFSLFTSSAGIDAKIAGFTLIVAGFQAAYDATPEGDEKRKSLYNLQQKESKLTQMQINREKYGTQALLQKEFAFTCLDQQIAENDAYIAALENRKTKI